MKKLYSFGLVLGLVLVGGALMSTTRVEAQAATVIGKFQYSEEPIKNGDNFDLTLVNTGSLSGSTLADLYIDTRESSDGGATWTNWTGPKLFQAAWKTVSQLIAGAGNPRRLNCDSYSSYSVSGPVRVGNKILEQHAYVVYEGMAGAHSDDTILSTKDCRTTSSSSPTGGKGTVNVVSGGAIISAGHSWAPYWRMVKFAAGGPDAGDLKTTYQLAPGEYRFHAGYMPDNWPDPSKLSDEALSAAIGASKANLPSYVIKVNGDVVAPDTSGTGIYLNIGTGGYPVTVAAGKTVTVEISLVPAAQGVRNTMDVYIKGTQDRSATVAVGQQVSLQAFNTGEWTEEFTTSRPDEWRYDPFYLRPGTVPGTFTAINPGVTKVIYGVYATGNTSFVKNSQATITITGAPTVGAGQIKISESKYLSDQFFPSPNCTYVSTGCTFGGQNFMKVLKGWDNPVLSTEYYAGNETAARFFDLSTDPMAPQLITPTHELYAFVDTFGDFGPYTSVVGAAISADQSTVVMSNTTGAIWGWDGNAKRKIGDWHNPVYGIAEDASGNQVLLTGNGDLNVTALSSMPTLTHIGGNPNPVVTNITDPSALKKLPAGFVQTGSGVKGILANGYYWTTSNPSYGVTKLNIYKAGKSSRVASVDISSAGAPAFHIPAADADYLVSLVFKQHAGVGSPGYDSSIDPLKIFVYKFDGTTLTKVVDGLTLYTGGSTSGGAKATGIKIAGKEGIFAMQQKTSLVGDYLVQKNVAHAYWLKDLLSGTVKDVLANSPFGDKAPSFGAMGRLIDISSYVSGDSSYVYLDWGRGNNPSGEYVWKLDAGGSTGAPSGGSSLSCSANPTSVAPSGPVVFTAANGSGTYSWTGGGSPAAGTGATFRTSYSSLGIKSVQVNDGTNSASCSTNVVAPASSGSCDFTLTPTPQSISVRRGSYFAIYALAASQNTDPTCTVSVTAPVLKDSSGNRIIYTSSADAILVAPGGQSSAVFNVSAAPVGSYTIDLKATARGISAKTISLGLTVN